jgi:hypothetical protein
MTASPNDLSPSTPNRRRRRIVVAVAVLVLGLSWWFWPRVDQRFVGRWKYSTEGSNDPSEFIILVDDGSVASPGERVARKRRDVLSDVRWFVHDNRLVYFHPTGSSASSDFVNRLTMHVQLFLARTLFRTPTVASMWHYDILEVSPSTIRLRDTNGDIEIMRRTPEGN